MYKFYLKELDVNENIEYPDNRKEVEVQVNKIPVAEDSEKSKNIQITKLV